MQKPLHIKGHKPIWRNLNKSFYKRNKLVHKLVKGKYIINFDLSGFDRDPETSLIIEAKKVKNVSVQTVENFFNKSKKNYNIYAKSLLVDRKFTKSLKKKKKFSFNYFAMDSANFIIFLAKIKLLKICFPFKNFLKFFV